jgi:hypothetical protein
MPTQEQLVEFIAALGGENGLSRMIEQMGKGTLNGMTILFNSQESKDCAKAYAEHLWRFHAELKTQGFTEEQAFVLTCEHCQAVNAKMSSIPLTKG